jgi:hypothetical protein
MFFLKLFFETTYVLNTIVMTNENDDQIFNIFCIPFFFSIELEINSVDLNSTKWVLHKQTHNKLSNKIGKEI